jgi:serine/threonine protein kinase
MDPDSPALEMAMDDGRVLRVPTRFSRYEYVKTLGGGGSSIVILVRHVLSTQLFACKVVSRQYLADDSLFDRFEQEVRILPFLKHPNVVCFEEVVFTAELIFLIMEYCCNGDLFSQIASEGMFPEGRARVLFHQIAEAVRFIHGKDIAHRDLKPDNVLLDDNFNPKVADFGLCSLSKSNKLLKTPCGSPLYAPPEIIQNQSYDGKAADIWSLGILLYTMVTGTLPWTTDNRIQLFQQIKRADIDIPPYFSPALQDLLANMLHRDPTRRFSIAEVLESPWFPAAPVRAGFERSASDQLRRPVRSDKLAITSPVILSQSRRLIVRPRKAAPGLGLPHSRTVRSGTVESRRVNVSLSSGPWE